MLPIMTNQSSILNDIGLKQFARMTVNIYKMILEKKLEQQEILGCFIHIQVELNK